MRRPAISYRYISPRNALRGSFRPSVIITSDADRDTLSLRAGLAPSGAPLLVYPDVIDDEIGGDLEICVPVAGPVSGDGEVYSRELEGGTMATTVHHGPYSQIGPAYHTLTGWISEHGHEIAGPPREIYLNDPQTVLPEELLTLVEFPICSEAG